MSDLNDAAAQLRRVLLALPALDDDKAHALSEVAVAAGTDEQTLIRDLATLIDRNGGEPPGFLDTVSLTVDATTVRMDAPRFFRRPMGLTKTELHALELGMAMLRLEAPPEEQGTIDQARDRLHRAIAGLASESADDATYAASTAMETDERRAMRKELEECIAARCVADLCYQSAHAAKAEWRRVRPLGFVLSRGAWFLIAFTMGADEIRVFRFDRISEMRNTQEKFVAAESFSLDDVVRDGRVLSTESAETLRIRYSPRIARWIAEREGLSLDADGSVTAQMPLLDTEWAVRYALQYGTEAEVIAPETVRLALRDRLLQLS